MSFPVRCRRGLVTLSASLLCAIRLGALQATTPVAPAPAPAAIASPAVPSSQDTATARDERLRAESSQLKLAIAQLQEALKKAGNDKLSVEAINLSQRVRFLAGVLERDLETP